ncbi:WGR domain-containing protein [Formosa sp. PL04]|uniref:WGR domain-containing protein n=1 Tax=Formosa sp. PL04 TaxID=3081755 RepID=UPI002980E24B|nr:WGR domain-containing protein [Formosa sp. PL04]MDW5290990.1 WGR domain-containing protein [Formosa sp. PL04]
MSKKTFQKPRDYINFTNKELAKKATIDPYTVFYECEMRIGETNEQDLELVTISISSLESVLDDIDEHNCVNLLSELGRCYSEDKLHQLLKERKSELNKALGFFTTGKLTIKTNPTARVFIQGKDIGVTPLIDIAVPIGDILLEFVCTETGERYAKEVKDITENGTRIIHTANNEKQKVNSFRTEFNKQIEKQNFSYTPTYFSFYSMMFDCEWDAKMSLHKMLEQGKLLSDERKKLGIRRFIYKKTEGFSDGYYNVKFWEIMNTGLDIKTQYGNVGTSSPRKNTKTYASEELAQKDFDKNIKAKLKSGFSEEN